MAQRIGLPMPAPMVIAVVLLPFQVAYACTTMEVPTIWAATATGGVLPSITFHVLGIGGSAAATPRPAGTTAIRVTAFLLGASGIRFI